MITPCPPFRVILRAFWLGLHTRAALDDTLLFAALKYSDTAETLWFAEEAARTAEPHDQDAANAEVMYAAEQHRKSIAWYDQVEAERDRRNREEEDRWQEENRRAALILPFIPADSRPGAAPVPPRVPPADPAGGDHPPGL